MHTRYIQVGGVFEDIPAGFEAKVREFCADMPNRVDQYGDLLNRNEILLRRLRGTCPLDEQTLLDLGVTGPLLRATGNPWDLRKAMPYSSYDEFEFRCGSSSRRSTGCPKARGSPTTARSRSRPATSSRPPWRR
jgi:NADH-quinone oxidoreductase subunit D